MKKNDEWAKGALLFIGGVFAGIAVSALMRGNQPVVLQDSSQRLESERSDNFSERPGTQGSEQSEPETTQASETPSTTSDSTNTQEAPPNSSVVSVSGVRPVIATSQNFTLDSETQRSATDQQARLGLAPSGASMSKKISFRKNGF